MNFSEVLRGCGGAGGVGVAWSPDGRMVAWPATPVRLEVRDTATLDVLVTFTCVDAIQEVEWSPDSCYILTASYKRGVVEAWAVGDPGWRCRVEEGTVGLIKARWAPDSRHLLTTADFYLQVTVWSLVNKTVSYIRHPKATAQGLAFSPDGEYLAVAERRDCKDSLSLFQTKSWELVKNFPVCTRDLAGVLWGGHHHTTTISTTTTTTTSKNGSVLAVWDSPLQYKVAIYSLAGHCLTTYSAYEMTLGIRDVAWSPSGQFLAVASFDSKIRLLNHLTWGVIAEFHHTPTITSTTSTTTSTTVYRESHTGLTGYPSALASARGLTLPMAEVTYQEETNRPLSLATVPDNRAASGPAPALPRPAIAFSRDGRYMATRQEDMPATVWVWDIPKVSLAAVLVHEEVVKDMAWDPQCTRLALCTGGCHLYFWTPLGTVIVGVPDAPHLRITSLRWHPYGRSLLLNGKNLLSVCFLDSKRTSLGTLM